MASDATEPESEVILSRPVSESITAQAASAAAKTRK